MRRLLALGLAFALFPAVTTAPTAAAHGGDHPEIKRCVGDPPRQTEDPMSPPCVSFFDGDNGGATYPGVTEDEIVVLIYADRGCPNFECPAEFSGEYIDLDRAPRPDCPKTWPAGNPERNCDHIGIRIARGYSRHFNERFQTYGRRVHFYMYLSSANSAATRKADAADNWEALKPFAVLPLGPYYGHYEAYMSAMNARGVLSFASPGVLDTNASGLSWGFWPDARVRADLYASYICQTVVNHPVSHSGLVNGIPRRLGLYYTTDPAYPGLHLFRERVKRHLRACGARWVAEAAFPRSGYVIDGGEPGTQAKEAALKFAASGVTTVLWLGGVEAHFSRFAALLNYRPEIVLAPDADLIANLPGRFQNQSVWRHAWGLEIAPRTSGITDSPAWHAYVEGNPRAKPEEAPYADNVYRDFFTLFMAVQTAGPNLGPATVDAALRASAKTSTDPYTATAFFEPGGHTWVKDAAEIWWDPAAGLLPGSAGPGCMRLVAEGARHLSGEWPSGDRVFQNGADVCSAHEGSRRISPT